MRDNLLIGVLAGALVANMRFWQYDSVWQPVLVIAIVAFLVTFGKLDIEDKVKDRRAATHSGQTE